MQQITLRVSTESIKFVRHLAGERRTAEAEIWRELIQMGMHRSNDVFSQLDRITRITIQSICLSERVAGHLDRDLIVGARNDARHLITQLDTSRKYQNED